jgi:rhamnogalacturonan endolyase
MHCADLDGDGRDEIILGSLVLDPDGKPFWTTGLGHPDHAYVGDIDPTRPGLEIYYGMETAQKKNGMCLVDARTGKILWGHDQPTRHVHGQGLCSDLDPRYPGSECYSADTDPKKDFAYARLRTSEGQVISDENVGGFAPYAAYWDATPQRALLSGRRLVDFPTRKPLSARIEGDVVAVADILGDWREEIVTSVPGALRIYATTIPATDRRPCLMRDPIYRIDVAHAAMGYFQVPMLSFDLATQTPR